MPREGGGGGRGRQHLPPRYRLLLLLREGFFVKGSEMAKALGISKTAVWKHISSLRREGYPIEARKKVGYRLVGSPGKLLPFEVAWGLKTKRIARSVELVHHRDLVDSTQNWAKFEAERGAPEGSVYISEGQFAGRGRMGREWFSPEGKGIWVSVLLRPRLPPRVVPLLSLLAATCAAEAVEAETGLKARTKWPNDIVAEGGKIGGVLVEMSAEADVTRWVVVGIGLNVNIREGEFPPELRRTATSVALELGREVERLPILRGLLSRLDECYDLVLKGRGKEALDRWERREITIGRRVTVDTGRGAVSGVALGATTEGALVLQAGEGRREVVWSGRVVRVE